MTLDAETQILFDAAKKARENSYSPYSKFKVGSALRLTDGSIFSGCNVENASYGATICAERVAIQKAISERSAANVKIKELIVVTDSSPAASPCGMCRQVMAEFTTPDMEVTISNIAGESRTRSFSELLPEPLDPEQLPASIASHSANTG